MGMTAAPTGDPFSAWPEYMSEAHTIIQAADDRGIHLRLLGALAVIHQCPNHLWLLERSDRLLTDLDFMGYGGELPKVEAMFAELGYKVLAGRGVTMEAWVRRRIFEKTDETRRRVDVFLDSLNFCHPIDLRARLHLDPVTIPLIDIFLEKLQIVEINEKDLKDLVVLFLEHEINGQGFDTRRVVELLRRDWGFYYTVSLNLERVRRYARSLEALNQEHLGQIDERIDQAWKLVEAAPKTLRWRLRARVGASKQWYQQVDEGYREVGTASAGDP
jgi:hypothetical protein